MNKVNIGVVGFAELLTICFIVLKLTEKISWSWVWVVSPLWISMVITIVLILIVAIEKNTK